MDYNKLSKTGKVFYCVVAVILFLLVAGVFFFESYMTVFSKEELELGKVIFADEKIKNLLDIFNTQKWQYMNETGSVVSTLLLQLSVLAGKLATNIINTVMVMLLGVLVASISEMMTRIKRSFPERVLVSALAVMVLLSVNLNVPDFLFNQTQVCKILYPLVLLLLYVWVYMREIPYDCFGSIEPVPVSGLFMPILGLFIGLSNEIFGLVAIVFSFMTISYVKRVEHNVQGWMKSGVTFSILSFLANVLAPGTVKNLTSQGFFSGKALSNLADRGLFELELIFNQLIIMVLLLATAIALTKLVALATLGAETKYLLIISAIMTLCIFASIDYSEAYVLAPLVMAVLAIAAMVQKIFERKPVLRKYIYIASSIIVVRGIYLFAIDILTKVNILA